jgi:hypothetical protein
VRVRESQLGIVTYVAVASLTFVFWAWLFGLVGLPVAEAFLPTLASLVGFSLWDRRWSGLFLEADRRHRR